MMFSKKLFAAIIGVIVLGVITPFPTNLAILLVAVFWFVWGIKRKGRQQQQNQITP